MASKKKPNKPKLNVSQTKIVHGKLLGKTQRDIGKEVYPNATPESASVLVTRELKKVNVQEALQEALARNGIDIDKAVAPIGKALKATKVQITGQGDQAFAEVVEDIDLQLKGSDRALKLMGVNKEQPGGNVHFHVHQAQQREKYDL